MRAHTLIRWGGLSALVASIVSIAIEIARIATRIQRTGLGRPTMPSA